MAPYNPWRRLHALPDWTVAFGALPSNTMGRTCWETRTITLALGQYQRERRVTIDHEIEHVHRGPIAGDHPIDVAREEQAIDRIVAHRLLPNIRTIADELVAADWCLETAAEALWVDADILAVRLGSIDHPAERSYLERRFSDHTDHGGHVTEETR